MKNMAKRMIRIFTRDREKELVKKFMNTLNIPFEIYTSNDSPTLESIPSNDTP